MRRFVKVFSALSMTLGLNACWFVFPPTPETSTTFNKQLRDADGDGFMTSPECDPSTPQPFCMIDPNYIPDPGCVVSPNPGGCAVIEWSQTITSDYLYTTCETCINADGDQVGETRCEEEQPAPPTTCWMLDESCWECSTPDGDVLTTCVEPTVYCESDSDCTDGESCIFYPAPECPPNALCAPYIESGVCGVLDPNTYCNTDEECPDGTVCTPNDNPPCTDELCYFYEPYYAGICTPAPTGCASDADCNEGEVCGLPCENITGYCPIGDAAVIGECFPEVPQGCAANTTSAGCEESGCEWIPDPNVACFTEPCDFGTCAEPAPSDPCVSYTDEESCHTDMFCAWMQDPNIVCVTEPCEAKSCQFVGCGDAANP